MEIYQQAVSAERRGAQNQVGDRSYSGRGSSEPFGTPRGIMKDLITTINHAFSAVYGGDDGARTRDLCRDRAAL